MLRRSFLPPQGTKDIDRAGLRVALLAIVTFAVQVGIANAQAPDFVPGQEWSIKSASPTTAKVIIGHVEPWGNTVSVSVSVVDIPTPKGGTGAIIATQIGHMPFEKSALAASVDRLVATGVSPLPQFESGYEQWKEAKGGIFTISVEKAIETVLQTINRKQGEAVDRPI